MAATASSRKASVHYELYADLAKETYKPIENFASKASVAK